MKYRQKIKRNEQELLPKTLNAVTWKFAKQEIVVMHHGKRRTPSWAIIPSGAINLINFFFSMMMIMLKKDGDDEMN